MPNSRQSPVLYTISKVVKYHLGSVALGSLLIVTFKIPRLILTYLYTKYKNLLFILKNNLQSGIAIFILPTIYKTE